MPKAKWETLREENNVKIIDMAQKLVDKTEGETFNKVILELFRKSEAYRSVLPDQLRQSIISMF